MFEANLQPRLLNPRVYPYWRATVWAAAAVRYQFTIGGLENIPTPTGVGVRDYYPELYDPLTNEPVDTHGFVLAPNHRSLADEWKQQVRYLIDQAKELIV